MANSNKLKESPSQTAGPYVHIGCMPEYAGISDVYERDLNQNIQSAEAQDLQIRLFDGAGEPVTDALIEIWIAHKAFWSRSAFDEQELVYLFRIPGHSAKGSDGDDAPHISVWIAARGINLALSTRMYFPEKDNERDEVLNLVEPERRNTLVAEKHGDGYSFDIYLQGENETVFFDD